MRLDDFFERMPILTLKNVVLGADVLMPPIVILLIEQQTINHVAMVADELAFALFPVITFAATTWRYMPMRLVKRKQTNRASLLASRAGYLLL